MITCYYNRGVKILLKIFFVAISLFCLYSLNANPLKDEYLFAVPLIGACVYGWVYLDAFKLEVFDSEIVQYGIKRKKSIKYLDVVKMELYKDHLIIKSQNVKIKVSTDLVKQKEAITFILAKLKPRMEVLKLKGDKSAIDSFKS